MKETGSTLPLNHCKINLCLWNNISKCLTRNELV